MSANTYYQQTRIDDLEKQTARNQRLLQVARSLLHDKGEWQESAAAKLTHLGDSVADVPGIEDSLDLLLRDARQIGYDILDHLEGKREEKETR